MPHSSPTKTEQIHIRLDPETKALLFKLAEQEKETISNYLRRLIRLAGKKEN